MKYVIPIFILIICYSCKHSFEPADIQWKNFKSPFIIPGSRSDFVILKDLNKDTYPDIITTSVYTKYENHFGINLSDESGHFQNEVQIPVRTGYTVCDIADLNNDDWPDVLTSYFWDNGIRLYTGTGLTTFIEGQLISTGVHGSLSEIYDLDNDGKQDLISVSFGSANLLRLHIFRGKGDGAFFSKVTYESDYALARSLNIADINQDGLPDIILASSFYKIPVFLQNIDHSFTPSNIPLENGECFDNALGDINNDGIQDIVYVSDSTLGSTANSIRIALGKGNGLFKPSYIIPGLSSEKLTFYLRLADINQDTNQDIITFDLSTKDIYYFLGNGNGAFNAPQKLTSNGIISNLDVGDINKDGFPDIVTVNKDSTISVFINNGL